MMAMALVGLATSTIGTFMQGQAAASAANYQAAVARNNAVISERNANFEIQKGAAEAEQQGYKTRAIVGAQKAAQAANGVDVNEGSPLDIRSSSAQLGQLDAMTLVNNSQAKSAAYLAQKNNFLADAQLDSMKADNYRMSSFIGAASNFSNKWMNYQMAGVLS